MKPYALVLLVFLPGCIVYLHPAMPTTAERSQETRVSIAMPFTSPQVASDTPPPVQTPPPLIALPPPPQEACERFHWPLGLPKPPAASFVSGVLSQRKNFTPEKISEILLDYVFTLRSYMDDRYQVMKTNYEAYLDRCSYYDEVPLPKSIYP